MSFTLPNRVAILICSLTALVLLGPMTARGQSVRPLQVAGLGEETGLDLSEAFRTPDGRVRVIVQLSDPPIALYRGGRGALAATSRDVTGERKLNVRSPAAVAYRAYLRQIQQDFVDALRTRAPSATSDFRYQTVLNGVAMSIDASELGALRGMAGVKKVYPDLLRYPTLDASLELIKAPALWDALGGQSNAGEGVFVAIVDSGIRPENPLFDGAGFTPPPGFPPPDSHCGTDPSFCNGKLIVARAATPTFVLDPLGHDTPLAYSGHGVHVAGIAVGNANVSADVGDGIVETISGVAPRAWLGVYKGLFLALGGGVSGTSSMLIDMIDQAVADGADVINNSWGSSPSSPAFIPETPAIEAAIAAGVVVVFAAGNSGPGSNTILCPGCVEGVITVANSTTNRTHDNALELVGPGPVPADLSSIPAREGTGPVLMEVLGPVPILYSGDVDSGNDLGCAAFPVDAFAGAIALIVRGSCNFINKVLNAEAGGAVAAVIFNNTTSPILVNMGGLNAGETISSLFINNDRGTAVLDWIRANPGAVARLRLPARVVNDRAEDILAPSSSRGPNGDPDVLKPDLTAPGTLIISGHSPETFGEFSFLSGTSMASPHVAGAAALLIQQHPTWSPAQIKTALTSTAVRGIVLDTAETPARHFDIGAGRIDLDRAGRAGATFDKPSMAQDACAVECEWSRTIRNELPFATTWIASTRADDPQLILTITPSEIALAPGESAGFTVTADTAGLPGGAWRFGAVVFNDLSATAPEAYLPVAVKPVAATNVAVLTKTVDLSEASSGETLTYDITLTNLAFDQEIQLVDPIPFNASFVEGSALAFVDGALDPTFAFNPATNALEWNRTLTKARFEFVSPGNSPFGYLSLAAQGIEPLPCSSVCDNFVLHLIETDFDYLGIHYDNVTMFTNGALTAGQEFDLTANQLLPNPLSPNNVIAPFWTDFDLDGTNPNDSGGGTWYAATWDFPDASYDVFEWEDVKVKGVPGGRTFTFQIWIERGTSNIWFVYEKVPFVPSALTIGAENSTGTFGITRYFNGSGTAPTRGRHELDLIASDAGTASFSYQLEMGGLLDPVVNVVELTSGGASELATASTTVTGAVAVPGDCTGDFALTIDDVPTILGCMAGPATVTESLCLCSDLNGDGRTDLKDFPELQRLLSGG